jgi:hypothetical protein
MSASKQPVQPLPELILWFLGERSSAHEVLLSAAVVVLAAAYARATLGSMSRAFVNEDAGGPEPRYRLPPRSDSDFDSAAAWALLEGADVGDSLSAEEATGYRWGEPKLKPHVERILAQARAEGHERLEELAQRFLGAKED